MTLEVMVQVAPSPPPPTPFLTFDLSLCTVSLSMSALCPLVVAVNPSSHLQVLLNIKFLKEMRQYIRSKFRNATKNATPGTVK